MHSFIILTWANKNLQHHLGNYNSPTKKLQSHIPVLTNLRHLTVLINFIASN